MRDVVDVTPTRTRTINSLSVNSDGETFISADDLRVNLWHLERSNGSFNIVDIKPENMEELTEVILQRAFIRRIANTSRTLRVKELSD